MCLRVFVFVGVCGMWLISRRRRLFLMLFFVSDRCSLKTDISGNCRRNHYQEDAHAYQDYDLLLINLHGFCSKRDLLLSTLAYTCFFFCLLRECFGGDFLLFCFITFTGRGASFKLLTYGFVDVAVVLFVTDLYLLDETETETHRLWGWVVLFDHVQRPRGDGAEGGDWLHLVVVVVASVVCLLRGARVILT